jgi:hypothetical protein
MKVEPASRPYCFTPAEKKSLVPIEWEAGESQSRVSPLWRREKNLVPPENQTADVQPVARLYTD